MILLTIAFVFYWINGFLFGMVLSKLRWVETLHIPIWFSYFLGLWFYILHLVTEADFSGPFTLSLHEGLFMMFTVFTFYFTSIGNGYCLGKLIAEEIE